MQLRIKYNVPPLIFLSNRILAKLSLNILVFKNDQIYTFVWNSPVQYPKVKKNGVVTEILNGLTINVCVCVCLCV